MENAYAPRPPYTAMGPPAAMQYEASRPLCIARTFLVTAILHIVAGVSGVVIGAGHFACISNTPYIEKYSGFGAIPLCSGVLIFVPAGIVGLLCHWKPHKTGIVIAYSVLSILSAVVTVLMIWYDQYILPRAQERVFDSCIDGIYWITFYTTLLELGCSITSASLSSFKVCKCCRDCLNGTCYDGPYYTSMSQERFPSPNPAFQHVQTAQSASELRWPQWQPPANTQHVTQHVTPHMTQHVTPMPIAGYDSHVMPQGPGGSVQAQGQINTIPDPAAVAKQPSGFAQGVRDEEPQPTGLQTH